MMRIKNTMEGPTNTSCCNSCEDLRCFISFSPSIDGWNWSLFLLNPNIPVGNTDPREQLGVKYCPLLSCNQKGCPDVKILQHSHQVNRFHAHSHHTSPAGFHQHVIHPDQNSPARAGRCREQTSHLSGIHQPQQLCG
ncbi:hypothetical protein D3C76_1388720 [compost metagenome]